LYIEERILPKEKKTMKNAVHKSKCSSNFKRKISGRNGAKTLYNPFGG